MLKRCLYVSSLIFCASFAVTVHAQSSSPTAKQIPLVIEQLEWVDKSRMEKELVDINQFAKSKIGRQFNGNLDDLDVIQQLIDRGFIKNDDQERQGQLGLVMGNVFLADFPLTLEWKVYRDHLGRSRALCAKNTEECIFPITLLIRRMQVGTKPNVKKIYYDTVDAMANYLPQQPYGGGVLHRLPPRR
ncbi:MAG: DUF3806 domain-containing protein [Cellvibrio sp.]